MTKRTKIIIGVVVVALAALAGTGVAWSFADDDDGTQKAIPAGVEYDMATGAALAEFPGATVTETEIDDEESKYEIELKLADGSQVDVQVDEDFNVVGSEADDETEED